ncbi:GntR family transcriptional regulator [Cetobacterium sp. 2G large]|uniref:GntR family transcriptional regulator n=1 Tax=Cetobacterium sp. 2G large TaxID=2759680 RepID=UPI00163BF9BE|nr:GntR family transcriptional regulator [Cetobacterium sp. 2G large]MBC2854222.1 GntR family transcriptional regulator [Cetobacterium sp. 2G large]
MSKCNAIEEYILKLIRNKTYMPGDKVISENKIIEKFNVSKMTARRAMQNLVQRGYLYQKRGSGTFVSSSDDKININFDELLGFTDKMLLQNKNPVTKILGFKIIKATHTLADTLKVKPGDKIYSILRLRLADDIPIVLEWTFMPFELFPNLKISDLEKSKYEFLKSLDLKINRSIREFFPIIPPKDIQDILKLPNSTPIFKVELKSYFKDEKIFEFSKLYYNQSRCTFKEIKTVKK